MKSRELKRKEAEERRSKAKVVVDTAGRCQDCKYHKNNPSKCPFYGYVGRKEQGCNDFRQS